MPNPKTNLYPNDKLEKLPPYKDYLYIFKGDEDKDYGNLSAFQPLLQHKKINTEELSDAWRYGGSAFPLQPILDFLLTYGNPETNPL